MTITGKVTLDQIELNEVDADPSQSPGLALPVGSVAFLQDLANGKAGGWQKIGTGDQDWNRLIYATKNVVHVNKNPSYGEYSTVTAALAAITDATATNRYVIVVGPGIYSENNPVVMKEYVHIVGRGGPRLTRIEAANANQDLFTGAHNTFMGGLYLTGVSGSGKCLVNLGPSAITNSIFNMTNCRFGVTDQIFKSTSNNIDNHVYIHECLWAHGDAFDKGFQALTTGTGVSKIHLVSCIAEKFGSTPSYAGYASGSGCEIELVSCNIETSLVSPGASIGFKVDDGGHFFAIGTILGGFGKAIQSINTGTAPHIHCSAIHIEDCTVDIEVNHTGTVGNFSGVATRSKITNAAPQSFVLAYTDPVNANFNNTGMLITRGLSPELQTIATSLNGTTSLTRFDPHSTVFTGTATGHALVLPNATTFSKTGHLYDVWNISTQDILIKDFGGNTLATLKPNGHTVILLRDISTSNGLWALTYTIDNGNVFGTQVSYNEDNTETSNNSATTWANKITLITPSLPVGDYLVQFQFNWRSSRADRSLQFRIQRGGSDLDTGEPFTSSTSDRQLISGFKRVQGISGIQTFTLDFRRGATSTTVFMYNARIFVWRIA